MDPNLLRDRSVRLVALNQLEAAPKIEDKLLSSAHAGDSGALLFPRACVIVAHLWQFERLG